MADSGRKNLSSKITLSHQNQSLNHFIDWRKKANEYNLPLLEKQVAKLKEDKAMCTLLPGSIARIKARAKSKDIGSHHSTSRALGSATDFPIKSGNKNY